MSVWGAGGGGWRKAGVRLWIGLAWVWGPFAGGRCPFAPLETGKKHGSQEHCNTRSPSHFFGRPPSTYFHSFQETHPDTLSEPFSTQHSSRQTRRAGVVVSFHWMRRRWRFAVARATQHPLRDLLAIRAAEAVLLEHFLCEAGTNKFCKGTPCVQLYDSRGPGEFPGRQRRSRTLAHGLTAGGRGQETPTHATGSFPP